MELKPEQIIQINFINWFNYQYPELQDDLHHFANERRCSIQQGRLLKRMGVKKGVSDLFLGFPANNYHGFWLELKTNKGKLLPEQIKFLDRKKERGYFCASVHGLDEAKEITLFYLSEYTENKL